MIELGKIIQEKRIEYLLNLADISSALKVKQEYLAAIERGDADYFSSKAYYFGYLKQYLNFLKIDADINTASVSHNQKLEINIPITDSFNPNLFLSIIALICSILIYNISDKYLSKEVISPIALEIQNHNRNFVELR